MGAIDDIAAARERQKFGEGWTAEHETVRWRALPPATPISVPQVNSFATLPSLAR
jgi:hypothetical protein